MVTYSVWEGLLNDGAITSLSPTLHPIAYSTVIDCAFFMAEDFSFVKVVPGDCPYRANVPVTAINLFPV